MNSVLIILGLIFLTLIIEAVIYFSFFELCTWLEERNEHD